MVDIPASVWSKYKDICDDFISSNFGVNCKLIYPAKRSSCANCVPGLVGGSSSNKFKHGGPMPFNFGNCPMCGGDGFKEIENTETIKLRVYHSSQPYTKVANISVPDNKIEIIGFMSDLPKVMRSNEIEVVDDQSAYRHWKFTKDGEPFPHGFEKDRYFIMDMKRV